MGLYKFLCVFMDSNVTLCVLRSYYASILVLMGFYKS